MRLTLQKLHEIFDEVYTDLTQVPIDSLQQSDLGHKYNGYNFFNKGDDLFELLIEPFRTQQPQSYQWLKQGQFFYAIKKPDCSDFPDCLNLQDFPEMMRDITQFGILINDTAYYINFSPYPYADDLDKYPEIPLEILNSWLYRSEGWSCPDDVNCNIYKSNMPSLLRMPLVAVISGLEGKKGYILPQYGDFLEAKFNHAFRRNYLTDEYLDDSKYFELRCLLDTRPLEDWSMSGYQLFISSHNRERNVYVVPHGDVFGMKKLAHPAEAIDRYAAHVFSRAEDEFDFMQFAEDF